MIAVKGVQTGLPDVAWDVLHQLPGQGRVMGLPGAHGIEGLLVNRPA